MDPIDERLVSLLRLDARAPMAELGRAVGLSRTAALARVRRLEAAGVIRGYRAEVDESATAAHVARVGIVGVAGCLPEGPQRIPGARRRRPAASPEREHQQRGAEERNDGTQAGARSLHRSRV